MTISFLVVTTNKVQAADKILSTKNVTYYAEIIRNNDSIASLPYGVEGYKVLGSSKDYMNKTVTITQEMTTDRAGGITWAYMTYGTMKGWIDASALKKDTKKPSAYDVNNRDDWTKNSITFKVYGEDTVNGIHSITMPDGNVSTPIKNIATYTVSKNGSYTFIIRNNLGNEIRHTVTVTKIDDIKPELTLSQNEKLWTNKNIVITAKGTDNQSGIKNVRLIEENEDKNLVAMVDIGKWAGNPYVIEHTKIRFSSEKNTYQGGFYIPSSLMKKNNSYVLSFDMTKLSGSIPILGGHSFNSSVSEVKIDGKIVNAEKPTQGRSSWSDGVSFPDDTKKHHVSVKFYTDMWDSNSDKNIYIQPNRERYIQPTWNKSYDALVENIQLESGTVETDYLANSKDLLTNKNPFLVEVEKNGLYKFVATDNVGNETFNNINISNIDKLLPNGTVTGNPTAWTNGNVSLKLTASDTGGSGYYRTKLPDGTFSTSATPTYTATANGTFNFIVYDNAGNEKTISEVVSKIDKTIPGGTITGNPTAWTNQNVTLTINATDTGGAGVKSIKKPDNTTVTTTSTTFVVSANGTYDFLVTDNAGNEKIVSVVVNKIDKILPDGSSTNSPSTWTNGSTTINFTATDSGGAGIKSVQKPDGTTVTTASTTYVVSANGTYNFIVTDNAGNTKTVGVVITNIDKVLPIGTITGNLTAWTNQNVTLTINATDLESGVKSIKKPDGTIVTGSSTSYTVTANGSYSFVITDNAGNTKTITETVNKIDKELPNGTITGNATEWTNQNVTLSINVTDTGGSGVKSIEKPDNTLVTGSSTTFIVTANGTFDFVVTDNAGNTKTVSITVNRIDKTVPGGTFTGNPTAWTNQNVTITINATDTGGSGVKSIKKPDNTIVTTASTTFVVSANGTYNFVVTDNAGNTKTESIIVSKIDKIIPTLTLSQNPTDWTNGNVTVSAAGADTGGSGVKSIQLPNGNVVNTSTASQVVTENGTYSFSITDNAGNSVNQSIKVSNIDKIVPLISRHEILNVTQDSFDVYVYGISDTESGINRVVFPTWTNTGGQDDLQKDWTTHENTRGTNLGNGTWKYTVQRSQHNYEFGEYSVHVYAYDNAGNAKAINILYVLKDQVKPTISVTGNPTAWTKDDVTLTVSASDVHTGVKSITLPDGTVVMKNGGKGETVSHTYVVTKSGNYTFSATDMYDNTITQTVIVNMIDKTNPSGTITPNIAKDWTNTDVLLTVKATDIDSGVKSITLPDGTITNGATVIFNASKNNDYSFVITDNVGNKTTIQQTVSNIDKGVPTEGSVQIVK